MKRTTIWLDEEDKGAIRKIRQLYGSESNSAAIRLALRILAAQETEISVKGTQD